MEIFDLGIAWDWGLDDEFVSDLNNYALKEGLKPYLLHVFNFYGSLKDITDDKISFRFFLDRTSEDDPVFSGLPGFLKRKGITFINHPDKARRSVNKFTMHLEFINHFMPVPSTVFLKPQDSNQAIELKIGTLLKPFVLKPQDGSSGEGIILDAKSVDDVLRLREQYGNVAYIAQEKIIPLNLENRPAWFRVLYCLGEIIPCWWHPKNHVYDILTQDEIDKLKLSPLLTITKQILHVCQLNFFSTEIALDTSNQFFAIDYVNDQPDMRKKSKFNDGVPDEVVDKIIENIISFVKQKSNKG